MVSCQPGRSRLGSSRSFHQYLLGLVLGWTVFSSSSSRSTTRIIVAAWSPLPITTKRTRPYYGRRHDPAGVVSPLKSTAKQEDQAQSRSNAEPPAPAQAPSPVAWKALPLYLKRLWQETNPEARSVIARDQATRSLERVQTMFQPEQEQHNNGGSVINAGISLPQQQNLVRACNDILIKLKEQKKNNQDNNNTGGPALSTINPDNHLAKDSQAITAHSAVVGDDATVPLTAVTTTTTTITTTAASARKNKKERRSVLFGATMGAVVAAWVFSGNCIFTSLFAVMAIVGQLEYYRMALHTGVIPARKVSVMGAAAMFITVRTCVPNSMSKLGPIFFCGIALTPSFPMTFLFTAWCCCWWCFGKTKAWLAPSLHQVCLPMFGLASILQLLFDRTASPSISDVATSFMGMFYLGYVPSFWVRIRLLGGGHPTWIPIMTVLGSSPLLAPLMTWWNQLVGHYHHVMPQVLQSCMAKLVTKTAITGGAIFVFWSWLCLAFSDVGAYFIGKKFGTTKLSAVSAAAGKTSPNKTVQGVVGGCLVSGMLATLGAWAQQWPYWFVTGPVHGILLGFLGTIGDLTASMLKRDAGLKDFGDLIPQHGGVLDRVDSFVWSAPYSWLVYSTLLPALRAIP